MAHLIAIGYGDETTGHEAAEEVYRLADELAIQPEAVAVITRDSEARYRATTNHHPVGAAATWGMFWSLLFGVLFFTPVCGVAVGASLGAIMRKIGRQIDGDFQERVRNMVKPGTSCLFLIVTKVKPGIAVEGLRHYGGTPAWAPISSSAIGELQEALHGVPAAASAA